jgi:uncharacterized protein YjiS (DUF1127 family)
MSHQSSQQYASLKVSGTACRWQDQPKLEALAYFMRRVRTAARHAIQAFVLWIDRAAERRQLATMNERDLKDIGLTRYDALKEWEKPFWRD